MIILHMNVKRLLKRFSTKLLFHSFKRKKVIGNPIQYHDELFLKIFYSLTELFISWSFFDERRVVNDQRWFVNTQSDSVSVEIYLNEDDFFLWN